MRSLGVNHSPKEVNQKNPRLRHLDHYFRALMQTLPKIPLKHAPWFCNEGRSTDQLNLTQFGSQALVQVVGGSTASLS